MLIPYPSRARHQLVNEQGPMRTVVMKEMIKVEMCNRLHITSNFRPQYNGNNLVILCCYDSVVML